MPLHWAKHTAGSSVTLSISMEAHGHAMTGTHTETLKEVARDARTIATTHVLMGQTLESDRTEDLPLRGGEETLKIDGKEYTCTVWSVKSRRGERESEAKVWLAEAVATPLKLEIVQGGESSVLVAVKLGERVSAGGKDYDCTLLDGELPSERGRAKARVWMSAEVPGMTVKMELDLPGHRTMKLAVELKEFKIAK